MLRRLALLACLLLISLVASHAAVRPTAAMYKVDPAVSAALRRDGRATAILLLDSRADLTRAAAVDGWEARGVAVYETLRAHAAQTQAPARALLAALAARDPGLTWQPYWIVNAIEVSGSAAVFDALAALPAVAQILPPPVTPAVAPPAVARRGSAPAALPWGLIHMRADAVWQQFGVTGQGVTVGSLDSGAELTHPALNANYRGNLGSGYYDHDYNWLDLVTATSLAPVDGWGHGTHTIGTMVGRATQTAAAVGAAPDAQWMAVGACTASGCFSIIAAGEWLLAPYPTNGNRQLADPARRPQIVNNSWGRTFGLYDPFYTQITAAWRAAGMLAVFAAGNNGWLANTVQSPADYCDVLAVGALESWSLLAGFSGKGPGDDPACTDKPDLTAPGVEIVSAFPGGGYYSWAGTSMAAPHVAGCAALLLALDPTLDVDTLSALLVDTTQDLGTAGFDTWYGYGRLDCYAAAHALTFMTVWPAAQSVCAGAPATWEVRVIRGDGAPFDAALALTGAPAGADIAFGSNPLTAAWPATTTLTLDNLSVAGSYTLTLSAAAPDRTVQTTRALRVHAAPPAVPDGLLPADGARNVGRQPLLQWQPTAADGYLVEIASDSLFASVVYSATVTLPAHRPLAPLAIGPTYHWRVTPVNACGVAAPAYGGSFVAETPVLYVNPDGARAVQDGADWGSAFSDLHAALAVAGAGSEIWLAAGTYNPGPDSGDSYWLPHGAALYGGFTGSETARDQRNADPLTNGTLFDGAGVAGRSVLYVEPTDGHGQTLLDGVTIRGGHAEDAGGGIHGFQASVALRNSVVTANSANRVGGGLYVTSGLTLTHVTLSDNVAGETGGALYSGRLVGQHVRFERNSAGFSGGALRSSGNVTLVNALFHGNVAGSSGGAIIGSPPLHVSNAAFVGNVGGYYGGGAIYLVGETSAASNLEMINVTFARNRAGDPGGALLDETAQWGNAVGPIVRNVLFWGNVPDDISKLRNGNMTIADSLLTAGCPAKATCSGALPNGNPRFTRVPQAGGDGVWGTADDDYGDLRPQATSPARDAGQWSHVPTDVLDVDANGHTAERLPIDAGGGARLVGAAVDIGAYECQTCGVPTAVGLQAGARVTLPLRWSAVILSGALLTAAAGGLYWRFKYKRA